MSESTNSEPKEVAETAPSATVQKKEFVRPPVTIGKDIIDGLKYMLFNPDANIILMPLLLLTESMVLKLIVNNVAYTEIDYKAYMEQLAMIDDLGELNYDHIEGGTGPLVYPAGHVILFRCMRWLTEGMEHVERGQAAFRYLYLLTLFHQFLVYYRLQIPPWCIAVVCLSKRLHSIYVLRLFNDCFTTLFVIHCVLGYWRAASLQSPKTRFIVSTLTSLVYGFAVSVKMNALLYLPGVLAALYVINDGHIIACVPSLLAMLAVQIVVALPFLRSYPYQYLHGAFNFSRQFMFEWSVNWQFIGEDGFLSPEFQRSLLLSQVVLLVYLFASRWTPGRALFKDIASSIIHPFSAVIAGSTSAQRTFLVSRFLICANYIGILFSRSLHYQFLTWYHWTIPIMLAWSRMPIYLGLPWYVLHEYCWNSYPPNSTASALLIALNSILLLKVLVSDRMPEVKEEPHAKAE